MADSSSTRGGWRTFRYLPPLIVFFGCRTLRFLKGADFDSPPSLSPFDMHRAGNSNPYSNHRLNSIKLRLVPGSTTNAAFSEYIYFDGNRAARRDYQSNVFFYFADQVGSARSMFEVLAGSHTASPPCFDADFYPFGGEHDFTNTCPQNYKFMGKERDPETNNDEFGARSYASAYGRFLSADWSSTPTPVPYANLTNPQTLNLYAMVSDNPESFADFDGREEQIAQTNNACGGPGSANCTQNADAKTGAPEKQPVTSVGLLGKTITITYAANLSAGDKRAASDKIVAATALINDNAKSLTAADTKAIGQFHHSQWLVPPRH
jgi:RHS repeat-associated protein